MTEYAAWRCFCSQWQEVCPPSSMKSFIAKFAVALLCCGGSVAVVSYGQTAGQDMKDAGRAVKNAGRDTGDAAKDTGHAATRTTKHAYRKVKHTSKHVVNKGAHETEKGANRVEQKTSH